MSADVRTRATELLERLRLSGRSQVVTLEPPDCAAAAIVLEKLLNRLSSLEADEMGHLRGTNEKQAAIIRELQLAAGSAKRLVELIDAANLQKLSRGVELGQVSWYVKASDALAALKQHLEKLL